jgi:hypothetical protein
MGIKETCPEEEVLVVLAVLGHQRVGPFGDPGVRENPKKSAIAWFESRDRGKTFTARSVFSHDPDIVYNQPSFEIPTGFNKIPAGSSPGVVTFTGTSLLGSTDEDEEPVVDNKVYFIRGDHE